MVDNGIKHNSTQEGSLKKSIRKVVLRTKEFTERNSVIEDMMNDGRMVPLYSIFLAITLGLIIHTAVYDYFYKGQINFGQRLILSQFSLLLIFWVIWIPLFLSTFIVYYGFKYWATVRTGLPPKSSIVTLWDYVWLGLTMVYYPGWLYIVTRTILKQEVSSALSMALCAETTRLLMKMHAFIRSNVPRVLNYKAHTENNVIYPAISQFMFFLWIPTLIYRDTYPRTKTIRWSYIALKAAEFVLLLFLTSVILERYFIYNFKDYGIRAYSWTEIALITLGNAGSGLLIMISLMYGILHVWQNAFAEICRFGDRLFYEDWWSSTDYERYYRTWNLIVHDWLYTYVYKDCYEIITPGKKIVAKYAVFFLSAAFHEYVLGFGFRFFMPIVFIQFLTLGTIMTYVKLKPVIIGNALMFYTLALGNAINGTFFALEYYARLNCPIENSTNDSFFVPRLFYCGS